MKHFLLIVLALGAMSLGANAQNTNNNSTVGKTNAAATPLKPYNGNYVLLPHPDTLAAADTSYLGYTSQSRVDMVFHITNTKVSGTVAGNIILQASEDNVTWHQIACDTAQVTGTTGLTGALTDATTLFDMLVHTSPLVYYRARVIQTGSGNKSTPTGTCTIKW